MTPRTPQCKVFWALLLNSKHSGVPEYSKSPTLEVLGFTPTLAQSGVATVGEYVIFSAHNSSFTPKFAIFFFPSYFVAHVAPIVSNTKQIIQIDGLAYGSSPITRARKVRAIMP